METENQNQVGEGTEHEVERQVQDAALVPTAANIPPELSPLNIIRTETVISRLPIHNLAKKGSVNIQIVRKTAKGEIDLKWEVSYSDRFGQPRQIAYKLDTVVINRHIDELVRPLPEIIRLGSLREIAQQLGLGGDTNKIKLALRQNASAFITAKFKYKANDGSEKTVEADFTRYSIIFTGEKFSDGRKADAVYIRLNPQYRDVLNNAPVRPLDYDYLKQLPPVAQRFYEIVSRKIFAALKWDHPQAKLAYSEFCTFSAQKRQPDYDHFKKQMYHVHRPHQKSGYISKVQYEMSTDEEGKPDWIMLYTPGEKARAEFQTFNGLPPRERRRRKTITPATEPPSQATAAPTEPEQGREAVDPQLLSELVVRGMFESTARKLLSSLKPEQLERVGDLCDYWDSIPEDKKTPGLLHSLIQNNDPLPPTFETRRQREERQAAEERREKYILFREAMSDAYESYRKTTLNRYIAEVLGTEEFERRVAARIKQASTQEGLWNRPEMAEHTARYEVRTEIAEQVSFLSFEDFRRRELPRILAELKLDPEELGIELPKPDSTPPETTVQDAPDGPTGSV